MTDLGRTDAQMFADLAKQSYNAWVAYKDQPCDEQLRQRANRLNRIYVERFKLGINA